MLQLFVLVKAWEWLRGSKSKLEPVTVSAAPSAALPAAPVKVKALPSAAGQAVVTTTSPAGTEIVDTAGIVIAEPGDVVKSG